MADQNTPQDRNLIKPFLWILIPLVLIIIAGVVRITFSEPNRDKRIKIYNEWSSITSLFTPVILSSSLVATVFGLQNAYNNYRHDVESNRRKSAFEYLNNITLGRFIEFRNELEALDVSPYRENASYLTDRKKIFDPENDHNHSNYIRDILNTFDLICTGIKFGVIDSEIAHDQLSVIMLAYWKWAKPYILLARMLHVRSTNDSKYNDSLVYVDYEEQVYKWLNKASDFKLPPFETWRKEWQNEDTSAEINNQSQTRKLEEFVRLIYETEYGFLKHN